MATEKIGLCGLTVGTLAVPVSPTDERRNVSGWYPDDSSVGHDRQRLFQKPDMIANVVVALLFR